MLTLYIGFVGRRFQKKSIAEYIMPMYPPFSRPFFFTKTATIFNAMRLIFETMRQRNFTVVSKHINYGQHNSDSALLCASHNCGHNLAGCLFQIILDITDGVESASAFSLLANIEN